MKDSKDKRSYLFKKKSAQIYKRKQRVTKKCGINQHKRNWNGKSIILCLAFSVLLCNLYDFLSFFRLLLLLYFWVVRSSFCDKFCFFSANVYLEHFALPYMDKNNKNQKKKKNFENKGKIKRNKKISILTAALIWFVVYDDNWILIRPLSVLDYRWQYRWISHQIE